MCVCVCVCVRIYVCMYACAYSHLYVLTLTELSLHSESANHPPVPGEPVPAGEGVPGDKGKSKGVAGESGAAGEKTPGDKASGDKASGDKASGEHSLLHTIARDHTYSSPTKQAPLERTAPPITRTKPRGKARGGGGGAGRRTTYPGPKKLQELAGDDLVSASQGEVIVFPGEEVARGVGAGGVGAGGVGAGGGQPLPGLGKERPEDKVAKWINKSYQVGFRIGLNNTSSVSSVSSPVCHPDDALKSSGYPGASPTTSSGHETASMPSTVTSNMAASTSRKFFKSKDVSAPISTTISAPTTSDSQDTYNFIPSQNTPVPPPPQQRRRGRGKGRGSTPASGRVRGRGRVRGGAKGGRMVPGPPLESLIVRSHDTEDEGSIGGAELPDSCPVNTLDNFDVLVVQTKEQSPPGPAHAHTHAHAHAHASENAQEEEEAMLFVTPAQENEIEGPPEMGESPGEGAGEEPGDKDFKDTRMSKGKGRKGAKQGERQATKQDLKQNKKQGVRQGKRQGEKQGERQGEKQGEEDLLAKSDMLAGINTHQLAIVTTKQEETSRHRHLRHSEVLLQHDLTLINLTYDNTMNNRAITTPMAPPEPPEPSKIPQRRVKFTQDSVQIDGPKNNPQNNPKRIGRANTRYASDLKHHLVDPAPPTRPGTAPVTLKSARSAKSPGWSHVKGARKDLIPRNMSLNISGGEERLGGGKGGRLGPVQSSIDSLTIEETQDCDVDHLPNSQAKKDKVIKLRQIVSSITRTAENAHDIEEWAHDTTESAHDHTTTTTTAAATEHAHATNNNNNNTHTHHNKNTHVNTPSKIPTPVTDAHETLTDTDAHTDSILLGKPTVTNKKMKLSLKKLMPKIEKLALKKPYIVTDTENLSPRAQPILKRARKERETDKERENDVTKGTNLEREESEGENEARKERNEEKEEEKERKRKSHEEEEEEEGNEIERENKKTKERKLATEERESEIKDRERNSHSHSEGAKSVVPIYTATEPFIDSAKSATAEEEKQSAIEEEIPQQDKMALSQQKMASPQQKMASPQQKMALPQQKMASPQQKMALPQQEKQENHLTASTGKKRKQTDISPQQEEKKMKQTHTTAPPHTTASTTDTPQTKITSPHTTAPPHTTTAPPDTATDTTDKPQRMTFSLNTDTEDLDSLLGHHRHTDIQTHSTPTAPPQKGRKPKLTRNFNLNSNLTATAKPNLTPNKVEKSKRSDISTVTSYDGLERSKSDPADPTPSPRPSPDAVTSDLDPEQQGKVTEGRPVVPFKSVGPLCSEK